ncbi:hypothetical protein SODALDRAFT_356597 [Sodiomyces alkalinus F11]|uniref:Uncharacterized protein n=1 Tax=Sodiomyces alkalinus (strain CBS 110278 / VKM F-3762 / F11) TaxID=1314773 RepID=A0A3N2Q1G7_SODAK|nr:hypothetical protein SODALDRAFT_356597 [Sodiomyces alkalinus F11]ROT40582.1 hypothetical protein SODALDRAFT_356597 [Sodiomyces alkalinus F11]
MDDGGQDNSLILEDGLSASRCVLSVDNALCFVQVLPVLVHVDWFDSLKKTGSVDIHHAKAVVFGLSAISRPFFCRLLPPVGFVLSRFLISIQTPIKSSPCISICFGFWPSVAFSDLESVGNVETSPTDDAIVHRSTRTHKAKSPSASTTMQYRSIASLAVVALAAQATAQQTRIFTRANQSLRDLGVFRRQDDGYQPEDEVCSGAGNTCAEACGAGYEQCSSSDSAIHCFNPADEESCCSTGSGSKLALSRFPSLLSLSLMSGTSSSSLARPIFVSMTNTGFLLASQGSCLAAFFCTCDSDLETWCCPEGQDLEQCASDFGVVGGLTLDASLEPVVAAEEVQSSSSSQVPESTSEVVVVVPSSSAIAEETSSYVPPTSSIVPTSSIAWYANSTTSAYHIPSVTARPDDEEDVEEDDVEEEEEEDVVDGPETEPTASPPTIPEGAADSVHSSASLALVAGIAFAALLL